MGPEEAVVFDTNVLVSAVGWRGPEHELYERCRTGELRLAISPELLAELERVLRYPRLGFAEEEIEGFISDLLGHATTVSPSRTVEVVEEDPDDNRVIECALAAGARWIVSGDKHLLGLEEYESIRIVGAATAVLVYRSRASQRRTNCVGPSTGTGGSSISRMSSSPLTR